MVNPFSALDLPVARWKRLPLPVPGFSVEKLIHQIDVTSPRGIRDRVILLLRLKYILRPSEISHLDVGDVDLKAGVVRVRNRRKPMIVIDEGDLPHVRRWCSIRQLYRSDDESFIISLHWTDGRSQPFRRIGVRGLFEIVKKYRSEVGKERGRRKQGRIGSLSNDASFPSSGTRQSTGGRRRVN